MAEYRLYTFDDARRIVSCHEVVCPDDRHAFIVSTTLGDSSAGIEIWQNQRFVGLAARRPVPGDSLHRPLVTTVERRDRAGHAPAGRPAAPREPAAGRAEPSPRAMPSDPSS